MQSKIQDVINYCAKHNISITSQQELILAIIVANTEPLTANDILQELKQNNPKANRMTIHRGLDYLVRANIVHRILYNLTYKLCNHFDTHNCQILICQNCARQIELHSDHLRETLAIASAKHGFAISNPIEITGYCKNCLK